MFNRGDLLKQIEEDLAILTVRVKISNSQGRTDVNSHAEDFYCGLLNIVLDKNLKNLNLMEMNFAAIDLADQEARLCIQVTSTEGRTKVDRTLEKFFDKELQKDFDRLIVLIIGEKPEYRKEFVVPAGFVFEPGRDVWDTAKLVNEIARLPDEKLEKVAAYLHKQLNIPRNPKRMNLPLRTAMAEGSFVGREAELAEIGRRLRDGKIVVLSGLGGMGKTELAVKFGREYEKNGRGWVYFVPFRRDFYHTVVDELALGIPGLKERGLDEEAVYQAALEVLRGCGEGDLLIVDNADEGSITALRRELSKLPLRALVTSRQEPEDAMALGRLSEDALFAIFRRYGAELEETQMRELIEAVDGHTMTVELMARLLRRERRTDTLPRLKKALYERNLASGEFGETETTYGASPNQARINEHLKAVFRVADMSSAEKTVLRFATLLGDSGLDSEMLAAAAQWKKERWKIRDLFRKEQIKLTMAQVRDVLQNLADKGWLLWEKNDIRIHPVVRLVCIEVLEPTEEKCRGFLVGIRRQYDRKQYSAAKFRQMADLFETAANTLEDKTGFWAGEAGYFWKQVGDPRRALELEKRAVEKQERHQPDSQALATIYNNLGATYVDLGEHKQALEYQLKALEIRERVLGADHPDLAVSYDNVGIIYDDLGDYKQALEYNLKALSIFERVLGEDHPSLATSYNNLSYTYGELGDHEKELEYALKALAIRERVLGADHPSLAASYNNVSTTYYAQGNYEQALEYQMKALAIRERVLPGNHPDLAQSCNNIALIYYGLGKLEEAASHMRRAAEIINRTSLPENHPNRVDYNRWADRLEREALQAQGETV